MRKQLGALLALCLVIALLTSTALAAGDDITVIINGGQPIPAASLEAAIGTIPLNTIESITVTGGSVVDADWSYIKTYKASLTSLKTLTVEDAVTSVADLPGSFLYKNKSITTVTIPHATVIGTDTGYVFNECTALETVNFPHAKTIGDYVFDGCIKLTTTNFPEATSIGKYAFYVCEQLSTVRFPKATTIGDYAFYECKQLSTTSFPEATTIGNYAFSSCALTSASFPKAKTIGTGAFNDCTTLVSLSLPATPPKVANANAFTGCPPTRSLTLVDANGTDLTGSALNYAIDAYKAVDDGDKTDNFWYGWKLPDPVFVPVSNITSVPATTTSGSSLALTGTVVPNNATNRTIVWSIDSSNTLAGASVSGNIFTCNALGTAKVLATIVDGKGGGVDYTKVFSITVTAAPTPPGPTSAPVVIYDDDGNAIDCTSLQDALDKIAAGQKAKRILLNSDQTVDGDVTIPAGVTLDLGTFTLTCKKLTISKDAELVNNSGQQLVITPATPARKSKNASKTSRFTGVVNNGTLVNKGEITLNNAAVEGDGMIDFQAGNIILKNKSKLGKVTMAKGVTIALDESFRVDGQTGIIFLPAECYVDNYEVLKVTFGADNHQFKLGNAPDDSWYIARKGNLSTDDISTDLIPEYLVVGKNVKTNAKFLLPWNYDEEIRWQSYDESKLKVVKNGKKWFFKGIEEGDTKLEAVFPKGETRPIPVKVVLKKEAVSSVGGPKAIKLKRGETRQLNLKIKPTTAIDQTLFWQSSDEKIATVQHGLVTAVGTGTCRVVAVSTSGKRKVIKVTVTKKTAIDSVTLTPETLILKKGDSVALTATVTPAEADQTLKWSSDKPKIASVKKGVVTAKKQGTAIITCKFSNGTKLTCMVTVMD